MPSTRFSSLLVACLASSSALAAGSIDLPGTATFNGVSTSPDGSLTVYVGVDGSIVHRDAASPGGRLEPSGTGNELFDVHVVAADFAVASGRDVLLVWDGGQWTSSANFGALLPVWAPPERDIGLFNLFGEGGPFDYRNAFDPATGQQLPGSLVGPLDLHFCGRSGDIKVVNRDGDFEVIGNDRNPVEVGGVPVAFDNPATRDFSAAVILPSSCQEGPVLPDGAYAVEDFEDVWRFSGGAWTLDHDVPAGDTITWVSALADSYVLAVGYRDDAGSNVGVAYLRNGTSWSELDLGAIAPKGAPGLTDVAMRYDSQRCVYRGGFEDGDSPAALDCEQPGPDCAVAAAPGDCLELLAAGEDGEGLDIGSTVPPDASVDLYLALVVGPRANSAEPFPAQLRLANAGPQHASIVDLRIDGATLVLDAGACGLDLVAPGKWKTVLPQLAVGDAWSCDVELPGDSSMGAQARAGFDVERHPGDNTLVCFSSFSEVGCNFRRSP